MEQQKYTDSDLVRLTLEGNVDFFAVLIQRYQTVLHRYIMRLGFGVEDAEDILQEVFVKAYVNLADFDEGLSFSAWIYRISRNTAISQYRKNKVRPQGNVIDVELEVLSNMAKDELDILKIIQKKELSDIVSQALYKLPDKYRDVLILRYFEDKEYLEISDILKIPVGTVSTLLYRAKQKLKIKLKEYE